MYALTELAEQVKRAVRDISEDWEIYDDSLVYLAIREAVETSRSNFKIPGVYEFTFDADDVTETRETTLPNYVENIIRIELRRNNLNYTSVDTGWSDAKHWRQVNTLDENVIRWSKIYYDTEMRAYYERTIPIPPDPLDLQITVNAAATTLKATTEFDTNWQKGMYVRLDHEDMFVSDIDYENKTLTVSRGKLTSDAVRHLAGTTIDPLLVVPNNHYYAVLRTYAAEYLQIARLPGTPPAATAGNVTAIRMLDAKVAEHMRRTSKRGGMKFVKRSYRRRRRYI